MCGVGDEGLLRGGGDQPLKQPSPGRVAKKSVVLTALPAGSMKKDSRGREL